MCVLRSCAAFLAVVLSVWAIGPAHAQGQRVPEFRGDRNAVAVVIGNRNYRAHGGRPVPPVSYAINDAAAIQEWLQSIGFLPDNILRFDDATGRAFDRVFGTEQNPGGDLLERVRRAPGNVFIFYSGHGVSDHTERDEQRRGAYLLPVDADPVRARDEGFALALLDRVIDRVREAIGPQRSVVLVVDACFSGATVGGESLLRTSHGNFVPQPLRNPPANLFRLTASAGDEVAYWAEDMQLGLMTSRFLLAVNGFGPRNTGIIAWDELAAYVQEQVRRAAPAGRTQRPQATEGTLALPIAMTPRFRTVQQQFERQRAEQDDDRAFEQARAQSQRDRSPAPLQRYIDDCRTRPVCRHVGRAQDEIARFQDVLRDREDDERYGAAQRDAEQSGRPEPLDRYIQQCERPGQRCRNLSEARRQRDRIAERANSERDQAAWNDAVRTRSFQRYLEVCPPLCRYRAEAERRIEEQRRDADRRQQVQPPPPPVVELQPRPGLPAVPNPTPPQIAVICNPTWHVTNLRSGPTQQETILAELPNGTPLRVIRETVSSTTGDATWYEVQLTSGTRVRGFVYAGLVAASCNGPVPPPAAAGSVVCNDRWHVTTIRSGPGTEFAEVASVPNGTRLRVRGADQTSSGGFQWTPVETVGSPVLRGFVIARTVTNRCDGAVIPSVRDGRRTQQGRGDAVNPLHSFWLHNDSQFTLERRGNRVLFRYSAPRQGMLDEGVSVGDILFDVTVNGTAAQGTARTWLAGCGPSSYQVSGTVDLANRVIMLDGRQRVRQRGTCAQGPVRPRVIDPVFVRMAN